MSMSLSRVFLPVAAEPNRMTRSGLAAARIRRTISRVNGSSIPTLTSYARNAFWAQPAINRAVLSRRKIKTLAIGT